jgi:arylsulfatase A-like enzyme
MKALYYFSFPVSLLLTMILVFACSTKQEEGSNTSTALKNIVMIIGDDHSAEVLGCYGNDVVRTPNLDKLASQGIRFTNAFANAPMCSASRQSFLTGKYPHATGVTLLTTSFPDENVTVAEHLKTYGFKTGAIGKMHFNNSQNHGFDYMVGRRQWMNWLDSTDQPDLPTDMGFRPIWKPFRDHARIWLNADYRPADKYDDYDVGSWYAGKAVEFIDEHKADRFCLWVGFHEPHSPFNFPIEFANRHDPDAMPLPTGSPEDDQWIPEVFSDLTEEEKRGIIAAYYTSVEYLDKNVGIILDKIEDEGLREKTLIMYIGDHGYLLNDHKRFEKHMMWEQAERAPLIINAGDRIQKGANTKVLTEFIDLAPTICQLLGVDIMSEVQGRSLVPILDGQSQQHRDHVFAEFLADNKAMIRTEEFKYIYSTGLRDLGQGYATGKGAPGITHRLYDLVNDPDETTDLGGHPEYQERLAELQELMISKFKQTHPLSENLPEDLSMEETLAWFCRPPDKGANIDAK